MKRSLTTNETPPAKRAATNPSPRLRSRRCSSGGFRAAPGSSNWAAGRGATHVAWWLAACASRRPTARKKCSASRETLRKTSKAFAFRSSPSLRARPRAMSCEPARKHSPRSAHRRPLTRSSRSAFFSTWTTPGSLTRPSSSTPCWATQARSFSPFRKPCDGDGRGSALLRKPPGRGIRVASLALRL